MPHSFLRSPLATDVRANALTKLALYSASLGRPTSKENKHARQDAGLALDRGSHLGPRRLLAWGSRNRLALRGGAHCPHDLWRGSSKRAKRSSNVLKSLGVVQGDPVATLAWNTARHIEAWYGIMGIGAVCHTLDPRLFAEQLVYIINHAEDKVLFTDMTFLPILNQIRGQIPTVKHIIVFAGQDRMTDDVPGASAMRPWWKTLRRPAPGAGLTEIRPRASATPQARQATPRVCSIPTAELPAHPGDHGRRRSGHRRLRHRPAGGANVPRQCLGSLSRRRCGPSWPRRAQKLDGASIHELLETEQVTFSAAAPTVWQMLLDHLRETNGTLSTLKRVVIGGSAVPEAIVRAFRDDYGVSVTHAWGMTETSPLGTQATPNHIIAAMSAEEQLKYQLKQGRPPLAIDLKLEDDDGKLLPRDGHTFGKLLVKGPFAVGEYLPWRWR